MHFSLHATRAESLTIRIVQNYNPGIRFLQTVLPSSDSRVVASQTMNIATTDSNLAGENSRTFLTSSARRYLLRYGVYISLGILLLFALVATPDVFRGETPFLILRQASQLGLVAIGQTLVILVAGLDLSVTGTIVLTAVTIAQIAGRDDSKLLPAIGIALLLGVIVGLVNSWLITRRQVPPFVATLGVLVLINGAQLFYTRGVPSGQVPDSLGILNDRIGPLSLSFLLWLALTVILSVVLQRTPFGRRIYAVGMNREAARFSGISVNRILTIVYVLCSLTAVLAGIVLSSYVGYVDRYLGRGLDLDSISAAIIGGAAFTGGRGNLWNTMAGVLIVQLLGNITLALQVDLQLQLAIKGVVIIAAVAIYSIATMRSN
jgi:ribose transport system permease protein